MKLYSIKNVQTERFNPPFVARDNDDAIETCRKAIIAGRDISLLVELENLELHIVGEFNGYTGNFYNCHFDEDRDSEYVVDYPCCIKALNAILLPEHIQKMIDKMKEVNSN